MKKIKILLPLIILFLNHQYSHALNKKLIVFAIDGMRSDILQSQNLSFFEKMRKFGYGTYNSRNNDISISGPSWMSVLTGVYHKKHTIKNNQFNQFPICNEIKNISKLAKCIDPNLKFGMYMEWESFYQYNKFLEWDTLIPGEFGNTEKSVGIVTNWLLNSDLDYYFIYLGEPDYWGHKLSFESINPLYIFSYKSINNAIEEILRTLYKRKNYDNEEWIVMTTTDHGGKGFQHNGSSSQERQVFWFASYLNNLNQLFNFGKEILIAKEKSNSTIPYHADICLTALDFLCPNTLACISDHLSYKLDGISRLKLIPRPNNNKETEECIELSLYQTSPIINMH